MKIVSACLAGINCRWDGKNNLNRKVLKLVKEGKAIPVCPEQLGDLKTPRAGSGIFGGDGEDVISGKAKVINRNKQDITKNFIRGAKEVVRIAKLYNIKEAIFKQGSPSCGCGLAFQWKKINGKWYNRKRKGDGVTTALLKKAGVKVLNETQI